MCTVVRTDYRKHCVIPHDSAYGQGSARSSCCDCCLHAGLSGVLCLSQEDDVPWKRLIICAHEECVTHPLLTD